MEDLFKKQTVYIKRKLSSSAYRTANLKHMPEANAKIGASISAVNAMIQNVDEIKVLIPMLTGYTITAQDFDKKTKEYFSSISKKVPSSGLELEIGFRYKTKEDRDKYEGLVDEIEKKYAKSVLEAKTSSRSGEEFDSIERRLFNEKYQDRIRLESTRYLYGTPISIEDYILWRYCLVYKDVANRESDISRSKDIRFYIHDEEIELAIKEEQLRLQVKATTEFNKIFGETSKVKKIIKVAIPGYKVAGKRDMSILMDLDAYVKTNPLNFLRILEDKELDMKAFIEDLLDNNMLRRLPNTTTIVNSDNETIGNSITDVVIFFKQEHNKGILSQYENRLKALNK